MRLAVCLGVLAIVIGCGRLKPPTLEVDTMPKETDFSLFRPQWAEGVTWRIICARAYQAPVPKLAPDPNKAPTATEWQATKKARADLLSEGKLPSMELEALNGYTLWNEYQFNAQRIQEEGISRIVVTMSYIGFHGIPDGVLVQNGLQTPTSPVPKLRYFFEIDGVLQRIENCEDAHVLRVDGQPAIWDWDMLPFPAGFPSFKASIVDATVRAEPGSCSQSVSFQASEATIWIGRQLRDLRPPSARPGSEFEIQKWRAGEPWWFEAAVVRDGETCLLARRLKL